MPPTSSSLQPRLLATRVMWVIAIVLSVGALSLLTAALPGRAKPLFLLPLAFGLVTSGISIGLRRSLALPCRIGMWVLTAAVAIGGYGQVVASSFRDYRATAGALSAKDEQALIALSMLEGAGDPELRRQLQSDLDARRPSWDQFLIRRYSALGPILSRGANFGLIAELLLVIAGVGAGRRILDARRSACQAGEAIDVAGDESQAR